MTPRDWTLLVLAAAKGRPLSPVQLQKSLFLLGQNLDRGELGAGFYGFSPYDYGPFSPEVYADAESLEREGFASITKSQTRGYREYAVTSLGTHHAGRASMALNPVTREYVERMVEWILPMSFDQLVRAIYQKYPHMKVNSVFEG